MTIDSSRIKRILVIKLRAIGDVLLSTVVIENLRRHFPDAHIAFLAEQLSREVLEGNEALNDLLIFNPKQESGLSLLRRVRSRRYDLVFDLFGNPRSALVAFASGAMYRVGFPFGWRRHCYNILVTPRGGEVHNTEFNLDALRRVGIPIESKQVQFPLSSEAEQFAGEFFFGMGLKEKLVIAINPGGGWSTKRWEPENFARLGDAMAEEFGAEVLIAWGPGEQDVAQQIARSMNRKAILFPESSLKQLGAILKRCSLLVTNDSGPMHIASAVGTPVVAIFGPTNPDLQGPVGSIHEVVQHEQLVCLGCNYTRCPIDNPCMRELPVQAVLTGVRRAITKNRLLLA